jgi:hypothetical protein
MLEVKTIMKYFGILIEMHKKHFKTITISNICKTVEELEASYMADKNVKWYNYFGKQLDSFLNKHTAVIGFRHSSPKCFPKRN